MVFRMHAINTHSYTHLILARGIVRNPTVRVLLLHNLLVYMALHCLLIVQTVLAGTAGAGGMASPTSTKDPARLTQFTRGCLGGPGMSPYIQMQRVPEHISA